ncbi:MAG: hypothetical protein ACYCOU_25000 [Sulfobacillus sp.]
MRMGPAPSLAAGDSAARVHAACVGLANSFRCPSMIVFARCPIWLLVLLLITMVSAAQCQSVLKDSDAAGPIGELAVIEGRVVDVHVSRKGNCFMHFGARYPNETLSGVVFSSSVSRFSGLKRLNGYVVRIRGLLQLYRGKPEIILRSPEQLVIVQ